MNIGGLNISWKKKGADLDVSTPYGNLFVNLTNDQLSRYMKVLWGKYSDSNLINMFHLLPEVFTPIHHKAFRVAQGLYQVKKKSNDEVVYTNKDLNRLLSVPNPLQNFQELVYEMIALKCVTGKSYLYANVADTLVFDYKNVATLWNLPSDVVNIRTNMQIKLLSATIISDIIKSYDVQSGNNNLSIPPEKVLYTKHTSLQSSDNKIIGASPLLSVQKNICNLLAVYEARNVIYTKRGALGFIVSKKGDADGLQALTKQEREQLLKDYQNTYGLTGSQSPVAITNLPIDYINVAMSIKDLEPFEETLQDAAAIFSVIGTPRSLMPQKQGSTYENQNQEDKSFYQNVIIPEATSLAQSLTNFLGLDKYGLYISVSFDHIQVLQENKKEKAEVDWRNNETYRMRFLYGIMTLNDWVVAVGLEKVVNPLYDKRIFDMLPDELAKVETIISLSKGGAGNSTNDQNPQNNGN